jgi:hypothetical protein
VSRGVEARSTGVQVAIAATMTMHRYTLGKEVVGRGLTGLDAHPS